MAKQTALDKALALRAAADSGKEIDANRHIRKCTAKSSRTGLPCERWAIKGGTVCPFHGGSAPQVKKAAQQRLIDLLEPALARLDDIMHQEKHIPSALGAVEIVLNRTLGKPTTDEDKGAKMPTINIVGVVLGGMPATAAPVALPEAVVDGEVEAVDE